jgi:hypothetical protein
MRLAERLVRFFLSPNATFYLADKRATGGEQGEERIPQRVAESGKALHQEVTAYFYVLTKEL